MDEYEFPIGEMPEVPPRYVASTVIDGLRRWISRSVADMYEWFPRSGDN